jgi:hypothetical protein
VIALAILILVDLGGYAATFMPTTSPQIYNRVPPNIAFLQQQPGTFRVASFIAAEADTIELAQARLNASWSIVYRIQDINGFNSVEPRRHLDLLFGADTPDISYGQLFNTALLDPANPTLDLFDTRYVLLANAPGVDADFKRRIEAGGARWTLVYSDAATLIYRNNNDPGRVHFDSAGSATAQLTHWQPGELTAQVQTSTQQLLHISETWMPGWRAEMRDGNGPWPPVAVLNTDHLFCGIEIPPGTHEIHLIYQPQSLWLGGTLSILGLLLIPLWMLASRLPCFAPGKPVEVGDAQPAVPKSQIG